MNTGAQQAHGDVLLFLHADCQLPAGYDKAMHSAWRHAARRATDAPPRCAALKRFGSRSHSVRLQQPLLTFASTATPAGGAALRASSWAAQAPQCGDGWCAVACGGARGPLARPMATRPCSWTVVPSGPCHTRMLYDVNLEGCMEERRAGTLDQHHGALLLWLSQSMWDLDAAQLIAGTSAASGTGRCWKMLS